MDSLEPGRQRVIPDAIAYLTSLGVPIGSGSAGGTLAVDFSNLSSPSAAAVTVRVSTPVEEGSGRAGLAFPGLTPDGLLTGPAFVTGLRQNRQDRSNLAVQNADVGGEERITLRVTNFSSAPRMVEFRFVVEAVETDDDTARFSLRLEAGEQRILPAMVDRLRRQEVAGIGAADEAFVGAVFATVAEGDMSGIVSWIRSPGWPGRTRPAGT